VSAEEALRRAGGGAARPLLAGENPAEEAAALLRQRASRYAASVLEVDTEGRTVEDVAAQIVARAERLASNHTT
jgi:shikimate kinase